MEISDQLLAVFTGEVDTTDNETYTIEVPEREIELGELDPGETYRLAVLSSGASGSSRSTASQDTATTGGDPADTPPVQEGEVVECEIESLGDQGDGIAKIGPGYVVVVPDTEVGERVSIKITDVQDTVGFAEVVERHAPPSVGH